MEWAMMPRTVAEPWTLSLVLRFDFSPYFHLLNCDKEFIGLLSHGVALCFSNCLLLSNRNRFWAILSETALCFSHLSSQHLGKLMLPVVLIS